MMRVLLIEDDEILANGLSLSLNDWGFSVSLAVTGSYADTALRTQYFDLVILDLGLPDIDGKTLLKSLRARKSAVPVLILTARDCINDRVNALECGADDYMIKPYELRELEARIRALLRRSHGGFNNEITLGRLTMNMLTQQILIDEESLSLPMREFSVLKALILNQGKVISKEQLVQRVTGDLEELTDNAIEVYIHRLRCRLEPIGISIRTIRGVGYLLGTISND